MLGSGDSGELAVVSVDSCTGENWFVEQP